MLKLELPQSPGAIWDEGGRSKIVQIIISHEENMINSLQFVYVENDDLHHSQIHGKTNGRKFNVVTFDYPLEFLTSVSGVYVVGHPGLYGIAFGTNKCMYGPFGKTTVDDASKRFNYEFGPRSCFGGFHGRVHLSYVIAIGIYIKPLESLAELNPIESPHEPNPVESPHEPNTIESLAELNIK